MKNLLRELTEPGNPGEVNEMLKHRAAKAIAQLANALKNAGVPMADVITYTTEEAIDEYRRVMNEDNDLYYIFAQ